MKFHTASALLLATATTVSAATDALSAKLLERATPLSRNLDEANMFRFDVESYSLKYAKCQMIEMFTDEVAEQAGQDGDGYVYDTVLQKQKFAVFRLCPTASCSASKNFGCDSSYGEYLIDLSVYLQTMQEFNQQKQESYCQYCEDCAAGNDQYNRKLDGAEEEVNYCTDSACTNYLDTCEEKEYDEYNEPIDYDEYLECKGAELVQEIYENGEEVELYIGPHCSSNGIKLGLYYDDLCTSYAGNKYDLNKVTGLSFSSSGLAEYTPDECLSCKESDNLYENNEYDNADEDDISELCGDLYMEAAKCDERLPVSYYNNNNNNQNNVQATQQSQEISCTYIKNVIKGAYNEKGNIHLSLKDYKSQSGYHEEPESKVTGTQGFFLFFFIAGCVGLAGYGAFLHKQVSGDGKAESIYQGGSMA